MGRMRLRYVAQLRDKANMLLSNKAPCAGLFGFAASRWPAATRWRVALGLVAPLLFLMSCTGFGESTMTVSQKTVVGRELRVILQTSRTVEPFWSHSLTTQDVKGYLIVVDLASNAPMVQRSKIYGPLWDVPQPRSEISFSAGANFTQTDVDAALATPRCAFDENGELVRYRNDLAHKKILFDRLDVPTATWRQPAVLTPIDDRAPPMSEDQVISPSGRYMLLYQKDTARLFDLYTGQEAPDPWLTARFAESRRIPKFENVSTFFTDDLDHLVVSPRAIWNEGPGAAMHETFDFGGKTLSRAECFLCADRPEPSLGVVYRKPDQREFLAEAPTAAYTIDHQLMLMYASAKAVLLYRRDGTIVYHTEAKVPAGWRNGAFGTLHIPAAGQFVFFYVDLEHMDKDQIMDRHVALNTWDYRRGVVTSYVVPVVDLFREDGGRYEVRGQAITVKQPKESKRRSTTPLPAHPPPPYSAAAGPLTR
jgi:hypothetical protein